MKKKYSEQELNEEFREYLKHVVESFGEPYDDRVSRGADQPSLRMVAAKWDISLQKARQLLITAGVYSTELSRSILELMNSGLSDTEIQERLKISQSTFYSYRPYIKRAYGGKNLAERGTESRSLRTRKKSVEKLLKNPSKSALMDAIKVHSGYRFIDAECKRFTYALSGSGIVLDNVQISDEELWKQFCSGEVTGRLKEIFLRFQGLKKSDK